MSYHIQLNMTVESQNVTIHDLRIQVPEPRPVPVSERFVPLEQAKAKVEEKEESKYGEHTEYVAVSPRYTWSDEHVRALKQDRFGELLWPVVLASYGIEITDKKPLTRYASFRDSSMMKHSSRYPHHTLRDLMEYYIEDMMFALKGRLPAEEKASFERRRLLRRMVLGRGMAWSPEYMEVYRVWRQAQPLRTSQTTGKPVIQNRYQTMRMFLDEFFESSKDTHAV